jgi:hypothetical protein
MQAPGTTVSGIQASKQARSTNYKLACQERSRASRIRRETETWQHQDGMAAPGRYGSTRTVWHRVVQSTRGLPPCIERLSRPTCRQTRGGCLKRSAIASASRPSTTRCCWTSCGEMLRSSMSMRSLTFLGWTSPSWMLQRSFASLSSHVSSCAGGRRNERCRTPGLSAACIPPNMLAIFFSFSVTECTGCYCHSTNT